MKQASEDDHRLESELYAAIASIRSVEEAQKFFIDLCTPAEIQALAPTRRPRRGTRATNGGSVSISRAHAWGYSNARRLRYMAAAFSNVPKCPY